jgi:hypothetical protein
MTSRRGRIRAFVFLAAFFLMFLPFAGVAQSDAPVIAAKLAGNLNTKSAKVGDVLSAKTLKAVKLKDGTAVPKGSKLTGKVISVQSMQAGGGTSSLAIKFDQLEVKGAAAVPIEGLIIAIGPSPDSSTGSYDPITGASKPGGGSKDSTDIPAGSSLEGVALSTTLDSEGASEMRGVKRDIKLDSDVVIKLQVK